MNFTRKYAQMIGFFVIFIIQLSLIGINTPLNSYQIEFNQVIVKFPYNDNPIDTNSEIVNPTQNIIYFNDKIQKIIDNEGIQQPFKTELNININKNIVNSTLTPQGPIYINSNYEIDFFANSLNWTGNGSISNPYLIQEYYFSAENSFDNLLVFKNTDLFCEIRNSHFSGSQYQIYLNNVKNIKIINCFFENTLVDAVIIDTALNCFISECFFSKTNGKQLYADSITNSTIYNNNFSENDEIAVLCDNLRNCEFNNNTFSNNQYAGINIRDGMNVTIKNCTFNQNQKYGILTGGGSYFYLYENLFLNNNIGAAIQSVNNTIIGFNMFTNNTNIGLNIEGIYRYTILNNTFFENRNIAIELKSPALLEFNNFINNNYDKLNPYTQNHPFTISNTQTTLFGNFYGTQLTDENDDTIADEPFTFTTIEFNITDPYPSSIFLINSNITKYYSIWTSPVPFFQEKVPRLVYNQIDGYFMYLLSKSGIIFWTPSYINGQDQNISYSIFYKSLNFSNWITLTEKIHDTNFYWDVSNFKTNIYEIRIIAELNGIEKWLPFTTQVLIFNENLENSIKFNLLYNPIPNKYISNIEFDLDQGEFKDIIKDLNMNFELHLKSLKDGKNFTLTTDLNNDHKFRYDKMDLPSGYYEPFIRITGTNIMFKFEKIYYLSLPEFIPIICLESIFLFIFIKSWKKGIKWIKRKKSNSKVLEIFKKL